MIGTSDTDAKGVPVLGYIGVIITIATGSAYLLVYGLEIGTATRLCLSHTFVEVSTANVLAFASAFAVLCTPLPMFIVAVGSIPAKRFGPKLLIAFIFAAVTASFTNTVVRGLGHEDIARVIFIVCFIALTPFVYGSILRSLARLSDRQDVSPAVWLLLCGIPFFASLWFAASTYGYLTAGSGPFYFARPSDNSLQVIVARYGDVLYTGEYDRSRNAIIPRYRAYKVGDGVISIFEAPTPPKLPQCPGRQ